MNWFKKHLNWSLFFAGLIAIALTFMGSSVLIVFAVVALLSVEIWYLLQKRRSLFYLLLNLLALIGFIVLLILENKTIPLITKFARGEGEA